MDVQMPVLDGYRATHLIRHHSPYNSIPGIQQTPIVAMTASAIQGDREKCERAGMDDYLAKPVRSHTLESMLVKWALRVKSSDLDSKSFHSTHTNSDSNCAEVHTTSPPLKSATPTPAPATAAPSTVTSTPGASSSPTLRRQAQAHALAGTVDRLPGAENEGDRGLRRAAAEEKALELRNDKLLSAAEEEPHTISHSGHQALHGQVSPSAELAPTHPAPVALTEENVGKLTKQRRQGSKISGDTEDGEEDDDEEEVEQNERNDRLATLGAHGVTSNVSLSAHQGSISEGPLSGAGSGGSLSANASARGSGTPNSSEAAASTALAGARSPLASPPLVVDDDEDESEGEVVKNGGIGGARRKGSEGAGEKGRLKRPTRAGVERHSSSRTVVPFER